MVKRWESASCGTAPDWADTFNRALSPGTWQDSVAAQPEDACFRVQLVNRYGAGRAPVSRLLRRWSAPPPAPDAPVVDFASWTPSDHSFLSSATYPAGTHLKYVVGENPSDCPGDYTTGGEAVVEDPEQPGIVQFFTDLPDVCVSFYAVDDVTGTASEPTSIVAEAPLPTETVNVGPLYRTAPPRISSGMHASPDRGRATESRPQALRGLPAEVPDDLWWRTWDPADSPLEPDENLVTTRGIGVHCAFFTAMDFFGQAMDQSTRHGPVVMREFTQEGLDPPVVESVEWDAVNRVVQIRYSGVGWRRVVAQVNTSDPATCPTTFGPSAELLVWLPRERHRHGSAGDELLCLHLLLSTISPGEM